MILRTLSILFVSLTIAAVSCDSADPVNVVKDDFDIQGHRGARGLLPENSIPSFIKAVQLGATTLELDLAVSKDSQLVVSHEPYLSHRICSHPDGDPVLEAESASLNIFEMDLEELQEFDCGSRGNADYPDQEKISVVKPTLAAVIDTVESYTQAQGLSNVAYNIEIKSREEWDDVYTPSVEVFVQYVHELIKDRGIEGRSNIQSFDRRVLQESREQDANITLAFLVSNEDGFSENINALGFHPEIYSPQFTLVNEYLLAQAAETDMLVIPWTINDRNLMESYINLGVDGIITDYPDILVDLVTDLRSR